MASVSLARRLPIVTLVAGLALLACASRSGEDDVDLDDAAVTSLDPNVSPEVAITSPPTLRALEETGFGIGHHFAVADDAHADVLVTNPAYASIARGIASSLDALKAADKALGVGMDFTHRLFDADWLRTKASRYALVAVTNRFDRAPASGACGETRFVYRLEHADPREGVSSRMPMTVAVVLPQTPRTGENGCSEAAKRWLALRGASNLADAAKRGPLANLPPFVSVETNLQAVRWPSSVKKDVGGEAEYMLNVWEPSKATLNTTPGEMEPAPLHNTPDVAAIGADPAKKARLVDWVTHQVDAIDRGTAKLDADLSARTVFSYGPRGLTRVANRPFSQLLDGADLSGAAFGATTHVKSVAGLVRKLDESSCQGCHQARAMAGFHMLGNEDDAGTNSRLNRLAVGTSPHFNEELAWRSRLVAAVAAGADPQTLPEPRPFAEHATNDGLTGASCGLTSDPSFASWTCKPGLSCADMTGGGKGVLGVCVPSAGPRPGDACEKDVVVSSPDARSDKVSNLDPGDAACAKMTPGASCSHASGGFPGGACFARCTRMGEVSGHIICGAAPPSGFNDCMAKGTQSFETCMSPPNLAFRAMCNVNTPCRDDYVCDFVPGAPAGFGACMPPYFIFQARVDGHE
jgi:hypothetical protein